MLPSRFSDMFWLLVGTICLAVFISLSFSKQKNISRHGQRIRYLFLTARKPCLTNLVNRRAPNHLPLIGHAIQFLNQRHELFDWFIQCQRLYGFETLEISVPTLPPGVIITNPANLEFVLKNEHLVSKGNFVKLRSWDLFGNGIINASGELWKTQRKAGLKFFSGSNLDAMVNTVLPEAYTRLQSQLSECARTGAIVDMQSVFLDFTSFVMGHMAYDVRSYNLVSFCGC